MLKIPFWRIPYHSWSVRTYCEYTAHRDRVVLLYHDVFNLPDIGMCFVIFVALAFSGIPDLRTVVKSYEGRPILETFDNRQRATYEAMRQQRVQANNNFVLRALTGLFLPDLSKENAPEMDMLPYEERKIAISAQRQAEYTKEMARLKVEFEKQIEANKAYLSSHKMPLYDLFTKGPPPPPPELFQGAPTSPTN